MEPTTDSARRVDEASERARGGFARAACDLAADRADDLPGSDFQARAARDAPPRSCACCGETICATGSRVSVVGFGRMDRYECSACTFWLSIPRDTREAQRVLDDSEIGPGRTPAAQRCPTHGPMRAGSPPTRDFLIADGSAVRAWLCLPWAYYERTHPDGRVWCGWRAKGQEIPGPRYQIGGVSRMVQISACPCCDAMMTPAPRPAGTPEDSRVAYCATCCGSPEARSWFYVPGAPAAPEVAGIARRSCRVGGAHGAHTAHPIIDTPIGQEIQMPDGTRRKVTKVEGGTVTVVGTTTVAHAETSACPRCGQETAHAPGEEPRCRPCGAEHRYLRPMAEARELAWIAAMRARHDRSARPLPMEMSVPVPDGEPLRPMSMLLPDPAPPAATGECVRGCKRTFGADVAGCMHERAR